MEDNLKSLELTSSSFSAYSHKEKALEDYFIKDFDSFSKFLDNKFASSDVEFLDSKSEIYNESGFDLLNSKRSVILKEDWDFTENIHGVIIGASFDKVTVDCLIDPKNLTIKKRTFPASLFGNIDFSKERQPVLIQIKSKPGSLRFNVHSGKGIVDERKFKLKNEWNEHQSPDIKLESW